MHSYQSPEPKFVPPAMLLFSDEAGVFKALKIINPFFFVMREIGTKVNRTCKCFPCYFYCNYICISRMSSSVDLNMGCSDECLRIIQLMLNVVPLCNVSEIQPRLTILCFYTVAGFSVSSFSNPKLVTGTVSPSLTILHTDTDKCTS